MNNYLLPKHTKRYSLAFLATILIVSFILQVSTTQTNAAPNPELESTNLDGIDQAYEEALKNIIVIDDEKELKKFKKLALKQIKSGKVKFDSENILDFSAMTVVTTSFEESVFTVTIPIVAKDYHEMSNVVLNFTKEDTLSSYSETIVKKSEAGTFHVIVSINGETKTNQIVNTAFMTAEEYRENPPFEIAGLNRTKFFKCMEVPALVGAAVMLACEGACMLIVPCIPCLALNGGFMISSVSRCAYKAWD